MPVCLCCIVRARLLSLTVDSLNSGPRNLPLQIWRRIQTLWSLQVIRVRRDVASALILLEDQRTQLLCTQRKRVFVGAGVLATGNIALLMADSLMQCRPVYENDCGKRLARRTIHSETRFSCTSSGYFQV